MPVGKGLWPFPIRMIEARIHSASEQETLWPNPRKPCGLQVGVITDFGACRALEREFGRLRGPQSRARP